MIREAMDRVLQLAVPNYHTVDGLEYSDKGLTLIQPPETEVVFCSTLQGLVDLYDEKMDDATDLLAHVVNPTQVRLISRMADKFGRRRVWAQADYPKCTTFGFGAWMDPETFIISAQQHFQRVLIENDDGSLAQDLDYVLKIASDITAEQAQSNQDDGIAQRVATRSGVVLKSETLLRPIVNLAPYRTFAEIDQVVSRFVFRARIGNGGVALALFEGDGGRWRLFAVAGVARWLADHLDDAVAVIS